MSDNDTTTDAPSPDMGDYIIVSLKSGDEPAFQKPDHDPHGETAAAAAHSGTSCDLCGTDGLVPTTTLEAMSFDDTVGDHLACTACAKRATSCPETAS